jgi:hypothetical protein
MGNGLETFVVEPLSGYEPVAVDAGIRARTVETEAVPTGCRPGIGHPRLAATARNQQHWQPFVSYCHCGNRLAVYGSIGRLRAANGRFLARRPFASGIARRSKLVDARDS